MGAAQKIIDKKTLQILVPFNALSPVHFNEVAQKTVVDEVRAGRIVFKAGDHDNQSIYLLEGEISLVSGNEIVGSITAGSDASRHPLAHQQPRQVTARAKTNVVVARVDSSLLDIMLTWDQSSGYEVAEIDEDQDDDWMTRILQSQAFLKLPPSNIQRLLMLVESVPAKAGDVIIRQGGEGDYFYIIKNGRCMVSRKPSANAKEVKLAELADGDAFGEDALVSDAKRNATVTMMTDGVLMRLAKKDFVELLKEPLVDKLKYPEAVAKVAKGAVWLDVRLPGEYENVHIPGSRNIPLSALRLEANGLDTGVRYIVCCDTGRRSASAAFVLSQRGFEVYVLAEGLGGVPADALAGTAATVAPEPAPVDSATADIVDFKPQNAATASERPPATDAGQLQALQNQLAALEHEKHDLEAAQAKLTGRVTDLQDELERVRDEAREQILELEQILADTRESAATAQAALQQLESASGNQEQASAAAREQVQALESELAARRAHEQRLTADLEALKARLTDFESQQQEQARRHADAETALSGLQAEIETLRAQARQAGTSQARIQELETAASALEQAHQEAEQQRSALADAHARELEAAKSAAAQRIEGLQSQVKAQETARAELEARLAKADEALAQALRTGEQSHDQLQSKVEALTAELSQVTARRAEQQAQVEAAARDLEALRQAQTDLTAERDGLRGGHERSLQAQSELEAALAVAQARIEALEADAGSQVGRLEAELQQANRRIEELGATSGQQAQQLEAALAAARQEQASVQSEYERLHGETEALRAQLAEIQSRFAAAETAGAQALETHQAEAAQLHEQLAAATQAKNALAQERDTARSELDGLRENMQRLEQLQADAASGQGEQSRLLAELRERLQAAEAETRETTAARSEIEARLDEMTAAASSARAALESAEQKHRHALADAEQRGRAETEARVRELESELAGARSALAREQSQRGNLESAAQDELSGVRTALEEELAQAREALESSQAELAEAESARLTLESELARTKADAGCQQQALSAEFEQLRMATSADVEAMQRQMRQLQEELEAARRLSSGGSADDELVRLRLLLDEAREAADSARADADQWREQALTEDQPQPDVESAASPASDELAAMRVQLADLQCRMDDALALRDKAQQEAAELRNAAQAQQLRETIARQPDTAAAAVPARRGGLWMGLAAGLILGVVGAGAVFWQGRGVPTAAPAPDAAVLSGDAQAADSGAAAGVPVVAMKAASAKAATTTAQPVEIALADSAAAARPAAPSVRTLHDNLSDGRRAPSLVEIPAATFEMGSGPSSPDADERPRHTVQLRRFAIGQYEVTFDDYDAFARATGRSLPDDKGWGRGRRPVINVSWEEAVAYTKWLSGQTGQRYRLPTEAEWEYAASGGVRTLYWWGNSTGEASANCFNCDSEWAARMTAPAGSFAANALGLHDSAGNVAEWVQDCYHSTYQDAPADGSARTTAGCASRVVRGGGFNSPASSLRLAKRDQQSPGLRADDLGFRVVREF
jgi:formylglycine-generating enzyme required for sulfatase activity/rhodanese-related sulfurtransferase/predicted  nucleic acid-binding Zn-ribbon protein